MTEESHREKTTVGALLVVAGIALFIVPATNIWPWVLGFWAVGGGLLLSQAISWSDANRQRQGGHRN
jgi:hypothetical protein